MPFQTELEWAKEICRRQGYYVIQASRVHDLCVRHEIRDYEADIYKEQTDFKDMIWRTMFYKLMAEVEKRDLIIKSERKIRFPYPTVRYYDGLVQRAEVDEPMGWPGMAFQSRITMIEP